MENRFSGARSRVRPSRVLRGIRAARHLALASTVSVLALGSGAALAQDTADDARWSAHGAVTARAGTERSIGELDLFIPLWQDGKTLLYGDARVQTDDSGNQEGNIGLGIRRMTGEWVLGRYGFFDYRTSDETGNIFVQGMLGAEALSETLDLRANLYIPENEEQVANAATGFDIVGGSLQMRAGFERALPGVDGEIGYRLWESQGGGGELRFFAGGYYFNAADYQTVAGPRGRIEARLFDLGFLGEGSRITLGGEVTHDAVRDTQGFALARLTIPFGGGRRSARGGLDRRMTDYVVRDVDIITSAGATGAAESVTYATSGAAVGAMTVLTAGDNVVTAVAAGGTGDLIILDGSAGAFSTTSAIRLQTGQALTSGGYGIEMVGVSSGTRATYRAAGTRATINGTVAGGEVITLASNTTVAGIDIANLSAGPNSMGIVGNAVSFTGVSGNSVTTKGGLGYGFQLTGGTENTFSNNTVTTTGNSAIGVLVGNSTDNVIDNNSITTSGSAAYGVHLDFGSVSNTVSSNTIVTGAADADGIFLSGSTTDLNTGAGNSYSGPASACTVDVSVTGTNTINLCP